MFTIFMLGSHSSQKFIPATELYPSKSNLPASTILQKNTGLTFQWTGVYTSAQWRVKDFEKGGGSSL